MKANYREMAKELSEIMHEQVCNESLLFIQDPLVNLSGILTNDFLKIPPCLYYSYEKILNVFFIQLLPSYVAVF